MASSAIMSLILAVLLGLHATPHVNAKSDGSQGKGKRSSASKRQSSGSGRFGSLIQQFRGDMTLLVRNEMDVVMASVATGYF